VSFDMTPPLEFLSTLKGASGSSKDQVVHWIFSVLLELLERYVDSRYGPGAASRIDTLLFQLVNESDDEREGLRFNKG